MSWPRIALAALLLAAAAFAALLAADVRSWQEGIRAGDARFAQAPHAARWQAATILPGDPAQAILGLSSELRFRRAARTFATVSTLGNGIDNGYIESRERGALETVLSELAQGTDHVRASEAENMLGILAFADSRQHGPDEAAPVDRSVAAFQAAVRLDPGDVDAKFNLEWLLHELQAKSTRTGGNNAGGGPAKGHRGAGDGLPGRGF